MRSNYVNIENVSEENKDKVKQTLKFKTGNFVWRIAFNLPLNPKSITKSTVYVTDLENKLVPANISYSEKNGYIQVEPLSAYAKEKSYILHVTTGVRTKSGKNLKKPISIQFRL